MLHLQIALGLLNTFALSQKLPVAWGVATSAYQIEGAHDVDGKGPSIWDKFFEDPIRASSANGYIAADHYHRMKEDIKYLGDLGAKVYRFSVSWPRIIPDCTGKVNEKGIQFYRDMIDEITKNGALPVLTLFHWDTPQACHDKYGSWLSRRIIEDFTKFSEIVLDRLGDKLEYVLTLNEPGAECGFGYGRTTETVQPYDPANGRSILWPPGELSATQLEADTKKAMCMHLMTLAHASVAKMSKKKYGDKFKFGMPLIVSYGIPYDDKSSTLEAADRFHEFQTGWHWTPFVTGDYPDVLKKNAYWGPILIPFTAEEQEMLMGSMDFAALNYYSGKYVRDGKASTVELQNFDLLDNDSNNNWLNYTAETAWQAYYPGGLRGLSNWVHSKYKMDVWITECGTSVKGEKDLTLDQIVNDTYRSGFYKGVLSSLEDAVKIDNTPIKAFMAWSLLDNFEWLTYDQRFGLISVERGDDQSVNNSLKRTVKNSALMLRDYFADNAESPFMIPSSALLTQNSMALMAIFAVFSLMLQ
jgi:beta-glucosidase